MYNNMQRALLEHLGRIFCTKAGLGQPLQVFTLHLTVLLHGLPLAHHH
jgi:hypothetical protein